MFRFPNKLICVSEIVQETCLEVAIEQFDAADFNRNDNGFIRNDIAQLARATSESEYQAMLKKLVVLKNEGGIPEGMKLSDAVQLIKPRYCQTPAELERFASDVARLDMEKLDEAYRKSIDPASDSASDSASEPASEPASVFK